MDSFGAILSATIDDIGIKRARLAAMLDVSPSTVTDWCADRYLPHVGRLPDIGGALRLTEEEFRRLQAAYLATPVPSAGDAKS